MAIFKCRICGAQYDFQASVCPSCGIKSKRDYPSPLFFIITAMLLLLVILVALNKTPYDPNKPIDYSSEAIYAARDLMEQRLKSPATAEFQSTREAQYQTFEENGKQLYVVTSYVDSENSFGANLRTNFAITMSKIGSTWYLEEIHTW